MTETVDQRHLWDNAEPGQPKPPRHDGPYCHDRHADWLCERLEGHNGQHVASGWTKVEATWGGGVL